MCFGKEEYDCESLSSRFRVGVSNVTLQVSAKKEKKWALFLLFFFLLFYHHHLIYQRMHTESKRIGKPRQRQYTTDHIRNLLQLSSSDALLLDACGKKTADDGK